MRCDKWLVGWPSVLCRGHHRRAPQIQFNREETDSKLKDKEHFRKDKVVSKEDNLN